MSPSDPSRVTLDARSLRGLAHPVRLKVLGRLREGGPSTATALAAELGESSGVTSYHLRQLAAYGFVVEDDAPRASRRERWWRAAHRTTVLEHNVSDDVETTMLVDEYLRSVAGAYAERLLRFADGLPALRETLGTEWADASDTSDWSVVITPEQASVLDRQIHALVDALPSYDPEVPLPQGCQRVVVQLQIMPTAPREPRS
ncbi:MAG TPA: helix-turn-helix domain-containing protein [Candidatus Nanopelagicales bacterium]|nr:helix-turn-helix domain-containing protein [Candidatus Nanopelagicales bacterium]